jgi:hypothetical protein
VSRARASCRTTSMDGVLNPRSSRLMYVRCRPALSARASWDRPAAPCLERDRGCQSLRPIYGQWVERP